MIGEEMEQERKGVKGEDGLGGGGGGRGRPRE